MITLGSLITVILVLDQRVERFSIRFLSGTVFLKLALVFRPNFPCHFSKKFGSRFKLFGEREGDVRRSIQL